MPPTILYVCGGMIIAVIVSYALFDLSRPTHLSQAEREAKRMTKEKKKYKRYTDAAIAYATQKDAEAKAFRDKHSEPLTYFHPPEDIAEPADHESNDPIPADSDAKPNTEENRSEEIEPIVEDFPAEITDEAPTEEIPVEETDEPILNELPTPDSDFDSNEMITELPQNDLELLEQDDFTEANEEDFASSVSAELAPDPTGLNSEAESEETPPENTKKKREKRRHGRKNKKQKFQPVTEEPEISTDIRNSDNFAEDDSTVEQNKVEPDVQTDPNIGPELQPEIWPEGNESEISQNPSEIYPNQDDIFPNDSQAPIENFNGRILHLRKTEDGLEYHPEDEPQLPENAWQEYSEIQDTPEGEVYDFEPGAEPGHDNVVQIPVNWHDNEKENEMNIKDNITPLYTENSAPMMSEWEDYPDTEIIPEETTDEEIPTTDSLIPNEPTDEHPQKPTEEE